MKYVCLCGLVCSVTLLADDRPNFTGKWQLDAAKSEIHTKAASAWSIEQTGDSISINQEEAGRTESLKCGTDGKTCKAKEDGQTAEIMFYYNGPLLVETDMFGHDNGRVVKKRLKMAPDGKTMEVEVMHITPAAPAEKWVFAKQ